MRAIVFSCFALLIASPVLAADTKSAPAVSTPTATVSPARPVPTEATAAVAVATMNSQPFSVEMHMTANGQEMVMKRTVDGPKTRMDITGNGMSQTIIMMGDEKKTMYMVDAAHKQAMKMSQTTMMSQTGMHPMPSSEKSDAAPPPPQDQGHVTLVGQETIDGKQTDKYQLDMGDKGTGTMWVDPTNNQPVRMEAEGNRIDFKNYQFGAQAADAFEIPKGYKVTDMDEQMAKMPKNMMSGMAQGMAGGMLGGMGGSMGGGLGASLGGMLGGPLGSMVGQYVGSKLGQKIGSTVGQKAASAVVH